MTQADLPTIQSLHQANKGEITGQMLGCACSFGASPGVIQYLLAQEPSAAKSFGRWPDCYGRYTNIIETRFPLMAALDPYRHGPRLPEEDIRALVDAWPESVIQNCMRSDRWRDLDGPERVEVCHPIPEAIRCGYSTDLIEYMMDQIPTMIQIDVDVGKPGVMV